MSLVRNLYSPGWKKSIRGSAISARICRSRQRASLRSRRNPERAREGLSRGCSRSRTPGPHYPGDYGKVTSCQEGEGESLAQLGRHEGRDGNGEEGCRGLKERREDGREKEERGSWFTQRADRRAF